MAKPPDVVAGFVGAQQPAELAANESSVFATIVATVVATVVAADLSPGLSRRISAVLSANFCPGPTRVSE